MEYKRTKCLTKKIISMALCIVILLSAFVINLSVNAIESNGKLKISVVNFDSQWGNIDANVSKMEKYIEEANKDNVEFLLFPEMAVNGYCYSNSLTDKQSKMAVDTAETVDGPTATKISELSKKYDMWIAYGATEVVPGDSEHAYNSIFACSPEGVVTSYQKIHPVEGVWCEGGTTPVILDTEEGKVGISICYDTYAVPELERYYIAQGCKVILNPTATSRGSYTMEDGSLNTENWQWYYENRLESIVDRDGVYIASADLAGKEYDDEGNLLYDFPGGSVVIGPGGSSSTGKYTQYFASDPSVQTPGMYTAEITVSSARGGDVNSSIFQPNLYTKWYADLADDTKEDKVASGTESDPTIATVNFSAVWGDLDANLNQMINYITEASKSDTDIIVFPEMALQGYCSSSSPTNETYRLAVDKAITKKGYYAKTLSEYAQKYDMYVIFGASEKIPSSENPQELDKAYNSAFCCSPDGSVVSYQKVQPVEGSWCMSGTTPVIVETKFGGLGLSICKDTYSYPELERYYGSKGAKFIVNPTATSRGGETRWSWYYSRRLESVVDRDKLCVISADLCGPQYDADGKIHSTFPGGSCVMAPLRSAVNGSYVDYIAGSSKYDPTNIGLNIGTLNTSSKKYSIGFSISYFNAPLYSAMYGVLAGTVDISNITATPSAYVNSSNLTVDISSLETDGYTTTAKTYDVSTVLNTPFASKSIYKNLENVTASIPGNETDEIYQVKGNSLEKIVSTFENGNLSFATSGGTYALVSKTPVSTEPATDPVVKVNSVKLNKPSLTLNNGKSTTLKVTVLPDNATKTDVIWLSTNTKIATVTQTGKVTAKSKGTAYIKVTAKDGSKQSAQCKITVKQPVTKVKLSVTKKTLNLKKSFKIKAMVTPKNANINTVKWTLDKKNIVKLSKTKTNSGKTINVTAKKKGKVVLKATATDGSKKFASCKVTVK